MAFLREFHNGEFTVVIEDDDSVAYAYLLTDGRVVSDVWLYNHGPAPCSAPWETGEEMPFRNPVAYLIGDETRPIPLPERVNVSWSGKDNGSTFEVALSIDGEPVAWLAPGAKPGWSAQVRRDGPVARVRSRADDPG